jgi:enoyl-CoA hydratase/carnithine racemase
MSAGKAFCAGADLASPTGVGGQGMAGINPLYEQAVRLFSAKKPIIAAVQGAAVGAGLGLALVADFRVAAPEARFAANFVKLGFHPGFGITHTLPRVIGMQRAQLMCLTGRRIKAEEALVWGLVDEIAPLEDLRDAAITLARELAENAPLAVESTRATLRAGLADAVRTQTDHELIEQTWLRATDDFAEGVRSVNERRAGVFVGA